ncbi:MAG: CHC2 zinc finger domain-containing protein, partial [Dysgonamonadaceae bacterium]
MIDQVTIERIQDAARIVDVVSDFITLRKRGANYVGLCPFHDDHSPSFYVSPAKNICKCFACGEGGAPVHFIMKHEQLSYYDALKYLAKKYHIEVEEKELT